MSLPVITRVNGYPRLLVNNQPFLILGLQWDCDSCFSAEEMNPLFAHAAKMGANTAALPVYWREVEPEEGRYDFAMMDERIHQARLHNLRIVVLWFATWKNACPFYAADYVRNDPTTYPRALDRHGQPTVSLCPLAASTWQRDHAALAALMEHLRHVDDEQTVILLQLENEPGILGSDRCYCPTCNEQFAAERFEEQYGVNAAETFSAVTIARFIERLAAAVKPIYPLPLYVNVALPATVGAIPGTYFTGGAIPEVLDVFRAQLHTIDCIAPDIYIPGYRDFQRLCRIYSANDNPLYIAEHSSSPIGRAERNVFYAIGEHGAIGFDPWAIDSPFPERYAPPLVDPLGGEWGPQAYWLRDSYVAIGRAMAPIIEAQGSERLFTCVQEAAETRTGWAANGCDVLIEYHDRQGAGRGFIVQQGVREFLLVGVGFAVRFQHPRPDGRPIPMISAEWGRFEGARWVPLHPMRREWLESVGKPISLLEPAVVRVILQQHESEAESL